MFGNAWFGDWLIKLGAFAVGFNPQQEALIERQMPNLHKLIRTGTQLEPIAAKIAPLVDQATPLAQQAMPLIEQALKEFHDLAPVLEMVLTVIERDMNAGKARNDAISGIVNKLTHF